MKRFGIALLSAIIGYVAVAAACYFLVLALSSNGRDREVEAAMTSVFFFGPFGAVLAFIAGIVAGRRATTKSAAGDG